LVSYNLKEGEKTMDTKVFSPIKYISQAMEDSNFIAEWKRLSAKDKADLKQYAEDEVAYLQKKGNSTPK
jgi:hypothetical protein